MKALRFAEFGPPEVLSVVETPAPHAGPGRVRIAVRAAGVTAADSRIRAGAAPVPLPRIPGLDAAGVIDQVGEDVRGYRAGDEVFGIAPGGACAEHAVLTHFARKPPTMPWAEAAGLPTAAEAALRAIETLRPAPGDVLLINGAAGAAGLAAAQLARARGLLVVGLAAPGAHDLLRRAGAAPVAPGPGLPDRLRALVPDGIDCVFDAAGTVTPDLVALAGAADRVVTSGPAGGTGVLSLASDAPRRAWHALAEAAGLFERGEFRLPVDRTLPLSEAPEAHRLSESGHRLALIL
ncbi:NADP-dependent oxidoreductase [Catenuloplanes atrovinosus]|uniref:NADPH:quinone reductase-like Zn-dependent oxidoreductase n=1 Tax=Catenuloplanes atrovinosus TaxID=137266 RepID=A0AAE3YJ73_9ACTN|nr:NADP-dependent oxidoreductase [Catenuloplanes atrovinosus]MDR7274838.1 NADPH:quinone reductase-like Zn-dependent oxidoreductase [Catenuloplanes atrovinosus]